jgi:MarR family transcriptional regulator, transcriptional regulator for hemolysin
MSRSEDQMRQNRTPDIARLVNRAARSFARVGDARLRRLGFGFNQVPVLASLRDGRALTQAELARLAGIEQPSMAQMLARMERDGLIQRTPDPKDARSRIISLTPATAERLPEAREIMLKSGNEALAGFTDHEVKTLTALLERLNQNLDQVDRNSPPL